MPVSPRSHLDPLRGFPRGRDRFPFGLDLLLPPKKQTQKIELLTGALDRPVVLAYGRHIVGGNVIFQHKHKTQDDRVTLFVALGEGEWDSPERIWVNGRQIDLNDTSIFHFHPGLEGQLGPEADPTLRNQLICSFFPAGFSPQLTFSRTAYAAFNLRRQVTAPGPGFDIRGIYKTTRIRQFDSAGNLTAYAYSFNPAWVALDVLLRRFLFPHGLVNQELPPSVKDRLDFPAWKAWADFCDTDLSINGQIVNRFESHPAFVDSTDLLRALEWLLLLGRAYLLERNAKFAPFPDQPRSPLLAAASDHIASDSLQLARRPLRSAANQFIFRYRALDSGVPCNDPRADFQPQLKEIADENHQDQVGRIIRAEIDLGNSTPERAERLAEYFTRRTRLARQLSFRLLPDTPGALDLLPGDVLTAPASLDYQTTQDYEVLEITDEPDGSRDLLAREFDPSVFVDTAGPQQLLLDCPEPGGGFVPNAPRQRNVLQNASFFRAGVAGQEGADRPLYWKEYSNAGASPAVPGDLEHLLADDRIVLKTSAASVDKIGVRTLWKNLGRLFKPGQFVALAVSLRHNSSGGTYDAEVKLKLDSDDQTYTRSDGSKFDATISAGTLGDSFIIRYVIFQLRADLAVPDALNIFAWSEATAAAPSNFDLELDFLTLTSGRLWAPYDPLEEIPDSAITWDAGTGLYVLPAYLIKEAAPGSDSGGAGATSGGGGGSTGDDFEGGGFGPIE